MSQKKPSIVIAHDLDIEYPEREAGYVITKSDWKRLRKRIRRLKSSVATFMNLGCLLIGIGITALFVAITLVDTGSAKHTVCWVVSITTLVAGGLLILFYFTHQRNQRKYSEEEVKDCLDEIEEKFPKRSETKTRT